MPAHSNRVLLWPYFEGVDDREQRVWPGRIRGDSFIASPTDSALFLAAFLAPMRGRDEVRAERTGAYEEGQVLADELMRGRPTGNCCCGGTRCSRTL